MEPLAILDRSYPPSLEVTDVFDDSNAIESVSLEEVLQTPPIDITAISSPFSDTITTTTAATATSSPMLSTTALALTDSKK